MSNEAPCRPNASVAGVRRAFELPPWLGAVLIVAAVVLAWSNSLFGPFVLDDESSIRANESIRDLASFRWLTPPATLGETVSGRPMLNFSFALNYAFAGLDVRWYHITNVAIHALAALALFGVVRRTILRSAKVDHGRSGAVWVALAASAVWAVHPLQTGAVTYVVQRAESLAGFFYLLTLYCFIRSVEARARSVRWTIGSVVACLLGMATKETVVTAPIVVLLYDRLFVAGSFGVAWRNRWRTYMAFAVTWFVLGVLVLTNSGRGGSAGLGSSISPWSYLLTQCQAIVRYGTLAYWPTRQVFDYGAGTVSGVREVVPELLLLCVVVGATVWSLWRNRVEGFVLACIFLALAPSSSFVPVATQTIAEHRMYLALAPMILITALGGRALMRWPRALGVGISFLVLALGLATFSRNRVYQSELTLWQDTVDKVPHNPRAHNNLGIALANAGRTEEAQTHYLQAISLQPNHAFAHFNLGNSFVMQRKWAEAEVHFNAALAADSHYVNARINLGQTLMQLGRNAEAVAQFRAALKDDNSAQDARTNLASLLIADGKLDEAVTLLREVLSAAPELVEAHYHLGCALEKQGQSTAAEIEFRAAVRLKPELAVGHLALGNLAKGSGDIATAEACYRQAIRLDSNLAEAQFALGNILAQQQQFDVAMSAYRQALVVDPSHIQARNNLANCQLVTGRLGDAIANYEEVLRVRPQDEAVRQNLEIARELRRAEAK